MLKQAKELYQEILSVDDYVELFGTPNNNFGEQDQQLLYKLIKQATTQFDSLVSPSGNVGFLYRWWNELGDNDLDNSRGFRLQKAIGSWVETMVQNGKFWVDGVPTMSSNIDYDIKSSSSNSNIEAKRKDIIQDLVAIGLTITSNLGGYETNNISNENLEDYLIYSKNYLNSNYVSLNSLGENQQFISGINLAENPITNSGDIWNTNPAKRTITNFRLQSCIIDGLSDNNQIIGVQNSQTSDKILDPKDSTYKFINQFDISYWDGLTKEQIYQAIQASGSVWNETYTYNQDFIVMYKKEIVARNKPEYYGFAISLQNDNIGHNPNNSPEFWKILPIEPKDLNMVIEYLKNYIDTTIVPRLEQQQQDFQNTITNETIPQEVTKQLDNLDTLKYKSEAMGEIIAFENNEGYETYKAQYGIDDSYFENYQELIKKFFIANTNSLEIVDNTNNTTWNFAINENKTLSLNINTTQPQEANNTIPLNYELKDDFKLVWTGKYFNGKKVYAISGTILLKSHTNNIIITEMENIRIDRILNTNGWFRLYNTFPDQWFSLLGYNFSSGFLRLILINNKLYVYRNVGNYGEWLDLQFNLEITLVEEQ